MEEELWGNWFPHYQGGRTAEIARWEGINKQSYSSKAYEVCYFFPLGILELSFFTTIPTFQSHCPYQSGNQISSFSQHSSMIMNAMAMIMMVMRRVTIIPQNTTECFLVSDSELCVMLLPFSPQGQGIYTIVILELRKGAKYSFSICTQVLG